MLDAVDLLVSSSCTHPPGTCNCGHQKSFIPWSSGMASLKISAESGRGGPMRYQPTSANAAAWRAFICVSLATGADRDAAESPESHAGGAGLFAVHDHVAALFPIEHDVAPVLGFAI